jgi:hypothetical protein|tara:strand:+ start:1167 stop:1382 length:216 start_codon:yes stop_codon:yes gene_type:complete
MEEENKPKFTRKARPVYVIMSVQNDAGEVLEDITTHNINIHSVHKDSDDVLNMLDGGNMPKGTIYKRIAID